MIQLFKNSLKYKDSEGNMQDSGVLFASEKEKEWELIETITIEEEGITSVVRTTEPDGTPYNFKNIYVYATAPNKSTENSSVVIYAGNGSDSWYGSIELYCFHNKSYDNVKAYGTFLESNGWLIPISSYAQNWSPSSMYTSIYKAKPSFIMKRISFGSVNSMPFQIGTTFEIYAIRA